MNISAFSQIIVQNSCSFFGVHLEEETRNKTGANRMSWTIAPTLKKMLVETKGTTLYIYFVI